MNTARRILASSLLLLVVLHESACTLINYGIGSAIDAGNRQTFTPATFEPLILEPGTKITVVLTDDREVKGKYAGLEPEAPAAYAGRYAASRAELAPRFALPCLGEPITVTYVSSEQLEAEFAGFALGRLVVDRGGRRWVRMSELQEVAFGDTAIAGETLALLLAEGALPLMTGIVLEDARFADDSREERTRIPLDGVRYVIQTPTSARTKGLIWGATVDALVLVVVAFCAGGDCAINYGGM